ncbi:MAG: lmo0937 family membrane protein [bacterium]
MLWTAAIILIVLWALGLVSSYTFGGFIHALLVAGLIVVIIRLVPGKKGEKK